MVFAKLTTVRIMRWIRRLPLSRNRFAVMSSTAEDHAPHVSDETESDETFESSSESGGDSPGHIQQGINHRNRDHYAGEERLCHLCMGHALPLRAVKGYPSKGLLPHAVFYKIDCDSQLGVGRLCAQERHTTLSRLVDICRSNWLCKL